MKKKTANRYHINPKFRAYGKARVDIAQRASGPEDWEKLWKTSAYPFPFVWGTQWKQCIEYRADDFAAEVGFFIDILGLPVNAFDPDYARSEEHTSELQSQRNLPSFPTRRSSDLWKQCIEYRADDFAAEVGFFIDILGLPVNAFDPDYA